MRVLNAGGPSVRPLAVSIESRGRRMLASLRVPASTPASRLPRRARYVHGPRGRWPADAISLAAAMAAMLVCRVTSETPYTPPHVYNITQTLSHLLEGYDIRLRPNFGGDPLVIGMDLTIASFDSISEVNMDYTLTLYLNQYWRDERLSFNSSRSDVLTLSGDFAEKIWLPDTFFANDKSSYLHDVTERNVMVRLHGDGTIAYGMRFTTTLACMMDLHYYPLDSQNCTVEIESYGYTVADVIMEWREKAVVGVEGADLPQFTIVGYETTDRVEELATGSYQRLSLSFRLDRNIGYFIFQTYLPSILIVQLSWVSFWINHEATSARVALGITTVLTMTTISTGVRSSLPRISYVKAIDIYLVMCFVFVFAALLEYAAVNYTYWGNRAKKKKKKKESKPKGRDNTPINARRHLAYLVKNEDILDLDEICLSPLPSLRRRQQVHDKSCTQVNLDERDSLPPSLRMFAATTSTMGVRRPLYSRRGYRRQRVLQQLRKGATAIKWSLPRITNVSVIDRVSRVIFPVSFIVFNLVYWCFYIF